MKLIHCTSLSDGRATTIIVDAIEAIHDDPRGAHLATRGGQSLLLADTYVEVLRKLSMPMVGAAPQPPLSVADCEAGRIMSHHDAAIVAELQTRAELDAATYASLRGIAKDVASAQLGRAWQRGAIARIRRGLYTRRRVEAVA